ncbi:hypothetical protein, partial [Paraburkholderia tuberum]|uniref:hypothetical protein n=1 Tax=Paraburkholderia tuberum TaxID=157910 RepID=UPI00047716C0
QNLNGFYMGARLKHRRKTTLKFKRYLVSGFRRGRSNREQDFGVAATRVNGGTIDGFVGSAEWQMSG